MTRGDVIVERGADRLQALAERVAEWNGLGRRLAEPLAEDASFLRKLKPSLIAARARGELATDGRPATPVQVPSRAENRAPRSGGPNPYLVLAIALVAGVVLARVMDWRSHAHPRD